ncbi:MAG: hypothetical protein IJ760_03300 [Bacteroidales bacterium]|nr:hypothetical protein [Bacteroidales bacterium]
MMQHYYSYGQAEPQPAEATLPSEQTIRTILDFARSYQSVVVDGVRIDIYLN